MITVKVTFSGQYERTLDFDYESIEELVEAVKTTKTALIISEGGVVVNFDNVLHFLEALSV